MNKKEYTKPEFEVIESSTSTILAGSGEGNGMENLSRDPFGGETLEQDADGYVWAESKRQGDRVMDE